MKYKDAGISPAMIRPGFIVLILLYAASLHGQESLPKHERLQVGFVFSADVCYRTLKNNSSIPTTAVVYRVRNEAEIPMFGYTAGMTVVYRVKQHWAVESGIAYACRGYRTRRQNIQYFEDVIDPITGTPRATAGTGAKALSHVYQFAYLDIPFKVNYLFGGKKLSCFIHAGVMVNLLLEYAPTSVLYYANTTERYTHYPRAYPGNRVNLSPVLGMGIDYKCSARAHVKISPTFGYGLLSTMDGRLAEHLWNAGLECGFYRAW